MNSPFKFLDSFTLADRDIFFGRDQEISELYRKVFESKTLLVYGVSGTGKSSLINCGLASRFDESDWLPVNVRRGSDINQSVINAINKNATSPYNENITVTEGIKSLYLDHFKPVYLIFDQFEELFIFGKKEERREFIENIKSLIVADLQCHLLFVIREEYMAGLTEFETHIPTIFNNKMRIEKMSNKNAIEVIQGTCKVAHIDVEQGFPEALLELLCPKNADVELTYLQVFLDNLFQQSNLSFTLELLQRAGTVSDLLGSFLEEQLKELDEPDKGLAILKTFVSGKGTKKQQSEQEISESVRYFGKDISDDTVIKYLQIFLTIRILREIDNSANYELRHDSLAFKIYEKITLVEKELLEIYQFLENALSSYQKRKTLLSANDLKYISPYEDKLFLNKETAIFIDLSKKEHNKIKTRIKRIALSGFLAVMIFASGAIMMSYQLKFSNLVWIIGLSLYIILFLPLFVYYLFKSKENRSINILFLVFTVVFIGNIYLYNTSIRNEILKPNLYSEQNYQAVLEKLEIGNDSLYRLADFIRYYNPSKDVPFQDYSKFYDIKAYSDEIFNFLNDLKFEAIQTIEGENSNAIENGNIYIQRIKKLNEKAKTTKFFMGPADDSKALDIKELLTSYKDFLNSAVKGDPTIKFFLDSFLNTNDLIINGDTISWEDLNFKDISLGFVLLNLTKLQIDIKYVESRVLSYQIQKQSEIMKNMDVALREYLSLFPDENDEINQNQEVINTLTDIDNNTYRTVRLGKQVWMQENLKTTKYNDGTLIPNVIDDEKWAALTTGAYCDYNNTPEISTTYGKLYNWYAVETGKLCPDGWHVPSDEEYMTLIENVVGFERFAAYQTKEVGTTYWENSDANTNTRAGFAALPGGLRIFTGEFSSIGESGAWWTSDDDPDAPILVNTTSFGRKRMPSQGGLSVRCIMD